MKECSWKHHPRDSNLEGDFYVTEHGLYSSRGTRRCRVAPGASGGSHGALDRGGCRYYCLPAGTHPRGCRIQLEKGFARPGDTSAPEKVAIRSPTQPHRGEQRHHDCALWRPQQLVRRLGFLDSQVLRPPGCAPAQWWTEEMAG